MRRPLVVLLAANAACIAGNVLTMLAVPWFVLQTTGSAALTGVASAASALPLVISAAFAGPLVDRAGPRRASVLSDLASGLIVVAIPALFLTAGLAYGVLLVLLFVRWLLATPGDTARRAMVPDLAARGGDGGEALSGYLTRLGEGLAFLWRERLLRSARPRAISP